MNRAAVIINEFGDVALDHELVAASSEQMTLLSNGCLCCTLRTDLQETLRELFVKRRAGEVIDFDRVFVETTGLADPMPVLHTLQTDGLLGAQYRLNGVVTLVDAVNGMGQLDTMPEAVKQAAVADRLVITKTDIADGDTVERLRQRLEAMNPFALITTAVDGELDPALPRRYRPAKRAGAGRGAGALAFHERHGVARSGTGRWRLQSRSDRWAAHDAAIHAFCLWFDKPFTWEGLNAALQALTSLRGPDLLRVKGIVHVAGRARPRGAAGSAACVSSAGDARGRPQIPIPARASYSSCATSRVNRSRPCSRRWERSADERMVSGTNFPAASASSAWASWDRRCRRTSSAPDFPCAATTCSRGAAPS